MAFKLRKRGRPSQKFIYRDLDNYGNIFPHGARFHKFDKENNRIILKKAK